MHAEGYSASLGAAPASVLLSCLGRPLDFSPALNPTLTGIRRRGQAAAVGSHREAGHGGCQDRADKAAGIAELKWDCAYLAGETLIILRVKGLGYVLLYYG